uniref:DNA primase n=1 Tax=Globodera pallida TaxID=36090 RepID=A0A183BQI6_GLOPA
MDLAKLELYLRDYYLNCYPYDLILKWLSYSNKNNDYLSKREFAFILRDDFHVRFLSFFDAKEFQEKLHQSLPYKIDIGAVYNRPPRDRKKVGDFVPQERELVFDIDLTDYDSIRNCCKDKSVCKKCWRWITIAVDVLENLLRTHFGFKNLLWVFSGRRGVHCWVADKKARSLSNRAREAVAKYLTFNKEGTAISRHRVHPFVKDSYRKIMDSGDFDHLVVEQGWLDSPEKWNSILKLCGDEELTELLEREFTRLKTPELRWKSLKLRFDELERSKAKESKLPPVASDENAKRFFLLFVMEFAYPRLDAKVTAGLNHLLKSPFAVHPKNGNVAIPLCAKDIRNFDLDMVPRIDKLSAEIASLKELSKENEDQRSIVYRQTSLTPHIAVFEQWIEQISSLET